MRHRKIVFVCTGNTCRSPMAEAVLKSYLREQKIRWYAVYSAGLRAEDGAPMSENSQRALREAGIPFSEKFCARRLTPKILGEAYAVICMTEEQLKEFPPEMRNVTSMARLTGREVPDPYGRDIAAYRATLRIFIESIPAILRGLHIEHNEGERS